IHSDRDSNLIRGPRRRASVVTKWPSGMARLVRLCRHNGESAFGKRDSVWKIEAQAWAVDHHACRKEARGRQALRRPIVFAQTPIDQVRQTNLRSISLGPHRLA